MPRDGSGVYSPPSGTTAVSTTTIASAAYNAFVSDLTTLANEARPVSAGGTGQTSIAGVQGAFRIPPYDGAATVTGAWTISGNWTFTGTVTLTSATVVGLPIWTVPTVSALASATADTVVVREAGRRGAFVFDSSDLSAQVTADTEQGLYVPRSGDATGASGAYVRVTQDHITPDMFGAAGDGSTDDVDAFNAMSAVATSRGVKIFIPPKVYRLSDDWILENTSAQIEGVCGASTSRGSRLLFDAAGGEQKGLRIYNCDGLIAEKFRLDGSVGATSRALIIIGRGTTAGGSDNVSLNHIHTNGGYRSLWLQKSLTTRLRSCRFTGAYGPEGVLMCGASNGTSFREDYDRVDAPEFDNCTFSASGATTDCVNLNGFVASAKFNMCVVLFGQNGIKINDDIGAGTTPKFFYFQGGGFENQSGNCVNIAAGDMINFGGTGYMSTDATSTSTVVMDATVEGDVKFSNFFFRGSPRNHIDCAGGGLDVRGCHFMNYGTDTGSTNASRSGVRLRSTAAQQVEDRARAYLIDGNHFYGAPNGNAAAMTYAVYNDAPANLGHIGTNIIRDQTVGSYGGTTGNTTTGGV